MDMVWTEDIIQHLSPQLLQKYLYVKFSMLNLWTKYTGDP